MGALFQQTAVPAVAKPTPVARVNVENGLAVMKVDSRLVLIDTEAFEPDDRSEFVVMHWDGSIVIDRPSPQGLSQYVRQVRLHSASPVVEGRVVVRRGVIVLGRIVREY